MPSSFLSKAPLCGGLTGLLLAVALPLAWLAFAAAGDGGATGYLTYLTALSAILLSAAGVVIGRLYERVQLLSERDDLTGLFNQNAFLRTAAFVLQLAIRHREPYAVMMMDIDHFKDVNDNHNHLVGSHVLKEIARIIERSTRKSDLIARFGGDEYVFCLPRTSLADAQVVAERIRSGIEHGTFTLRSHTVKVTVSIGVASVQADAGLDLARLLEAADQALYAAKEAGRNRVIGQLYDRATHAKSQA